MSTPHPSGAEPVHFDCFYCHRVAAGIIQGIPEALHPDNAALVCGDCYELILDVEGDLRFLDMAHLWIAEDGSLIEKVTEVLYDDGDDE